MGLVVLTILACQGKTDSAQTGAAAETAVETPNYDWTGTFVCPDEGAESSYTLRLHKRSVDGSYEMQYSKSVEAQTNNYAEYMFDAKDADSSITIRFMGSFSAPETEWPFRKGDTMCILSVNADSTVETTWKALRPKNGDAGFRQVSRDYH